MTVLDAAITTNALTRVFGRHRAVRDLSFSVPEGSIYGLLGPNGAGKTTTIRMLLGLIRPSSGDICVLGQPVKPGSFSMMRQVGSLVESPSLYEHLTGEDNLRIACILRGFPASSISDVLEVTGMSGASGRLVKQYSMGMKQRLGIALALLGRPRLLILDEPVNGFDPAGQRAFRDLLRDLQRDGTTILLSSHLLAELDHVATHLAVLQNGDLRFAGTIDEFRNLGSCRVVISVDRPADAERRLVREGMSVEHRGGRLSVFANSVEDAAAINRILVTSGIAVYRIVPEDSINDTFLHMTRGAE